VSAFLQFIANHHLFEGVRLVVEHDALSSMRQQQRIFYEVPGAENQAAGGSLDRKK